MRLLWCAAAAAVVFFPQSESIAGDSSADPKAQLAAVFKEGKALYDQGRRAEAMQVWDSASGYWDADPSVKKTIEFFQNRIQPKTDSLPAPEIVVSAEAESRSQETVPADEEDLPPPAEEDMDDPYVISLIYQKGKALHEQGRYEEADREWRKLDSRVAEHSGVKILIDSLKQSRLSQSR